MNGFILVASVNKKFLHSAIYSAETLKDYYPDAHVTLYTIDEWVDGNIDLSVFDNVVTEGVPNHKRAKLWALDKTPYEITAYIDADMEFMHEDVVTIWDQLPDDYDIALTKIRDYSGALVYFNKDKPELGRLEDHCGFFIYRNTPKVLNFMSEWWELFRKQDAFEWKWDTSIYPEGLRSWDQWSYWWLQNKTEHKIDRWYIEDDARWNFVKNYRSSETDKPIIIFHHTVKL